MTVKGTYAGENLVLIVGSPRSGTTWLQRLLASHPAVRTGQESHLFSHYIGPQLRAWRQHELRAGEQRGGVGLGCYFSEAQFRATLRAYMLELLSPIIGCLDPGALFVEKTPGHALYLPEIFELLPEVRVLHLIRDARDVVASLLEASNSWGASWAPRTARAAARSWVAHVESARSAAERLPASQYREIRYEHLLATPGEELRRAAEFLQLEWRTADIERAVHENRPTAIRTGGGTRIPLGGMFRAGSDGFVREPAGFVGPAEVGGWRRRLSLAQRFEVWYVARHLMRELGYR